ncbi:EAL domain-containing protein, partial [Nitrospira defluvii]|nr:EAL domain-containing protein [Nitrospira defluvii]
ALDLSDSDVPAIIEKLANEICCSSHYDGLTRLPNSVLFKDRLNQAIKHARRNKNRLAVMFLRLNRYKQINNALGHTGGDQLLQDVARRLTQCLRESDTVARMGGIEFIALLPTLKNGKSVPLVIDKIFKVLEKPFMIGQTEIFVTGSIGLSLYPENGEDAEILLNNAYIAMCRAKEKGKWKLAFFSPNLQTKASHDLDVESALHHALERGEFQIYYQPQVNLKNGKIVGVEALLRWERPGQGIVAPAKFIPQAEETGLILPIGRWVLMTAALQVKAWHEIGFRQLTVAVNVSALQFEENDFVEYVYRATREIGLEMNVLKLELTESILMKKREEVVTKMQQLKEMGVHLSIDDFGTGYSSLSYLKRFPIESIKIDRSFIHGILNDADDAVITKAIIALAHHLRLTVVAEGIETEEQLAFLENHRCDIGQGYLFSRPLPPRAFTLFLNRTVATFSKIRSTIGGHLLESDMSMD